MLTPDEARDFREARRDLSYFWNPIAENPITPILMKTQRFNEMLAIDNLTIKALAYIDVANLIRRNLLRDAEKVLKNYRGIDVQR